MWENMCREAPPFFHVCVKYSRVQLEDQVNLTSGEHYTDENLPTTADILLQCGQCESYCDHNYRENKLKMLNSSPLAGREFSLIFLEEMLRKSWFLNICVHVWASVAIWTEKSWHHLCHNPLEHGCYVKSDPRGQWMSRLEHTLSIKILAQTAALIPYVENRCSQNFLYQTDWLAASRLIYLHSFDWNFQILAG